MLLLDLVNKHGEIGIVGELFGILLTHLLKGFNRWTHLPVQLRIIYLVIIILNLSVEVDQFLILQRYGILELEKLLRIATNPDLVVWLINLKLILLLTLGQHVEVGLLKLLVHSFRQERINKVLDLW